MYNCHHPEYTNRHYIAYLNALQFVTLSQEKKTEKFNCRKQEAEAVINKGMHDPIWVLENLTPVTEKEDGQRDTIGKAVWKLLGRQ